MLQDGHALVADFGIGKALSAVEGDAFTQVGMSVGTPAAAFAVIGRSPWVLLGLPGAYVQRGAQSLGEAVYTELQARSQTEQESRMALASAASQLGRVDEAIAYAIDSVVSSDNSGPFFTRCPFVSDAFRAHPRYPELLRAMGL